jgi:hypothetical protein
MNFPFKSSYQNNNIETGLVSITNLLGVEIVIPNEQRLSNNDKIDNIIIYQKEHHKKTNYFNFIGVLNIHYCLEDKIFYLVDGQHRYKAMKRLFDNGYKIFDISIQLVNVDTKEQLKYNYELINKNTPLPEFPKTINKNIPEQTFRHFEDKYPLIWSKSKKPRRPHLDKNSFLEALGFLTLKLKIVKYHNLITIVEFFNNKLSHWNYDSFPNIKKIKNPKKLLDRCIQKGNIYLGMYNAQLTDYVYDWVRDIVKQETGKEIKKPKKRGYKKSIPKKIKSDIWNKYISKEVGEAYCFCCRTEFISQMNFSAGHIIPESCGGFATIDNLRPICSQCNSSMGNTNMREFIIKHYPSCLSDFDNNKPKMKPGKGWIQSFLSL